ncbi:MAG: Mu transposase C-terminal domain-containing protein [Bacteroidia bacterium]|nr:Mu transposase C-terminal domain-containing protein [Bacteroidia bacterium]
MERYGYNEVSISVDELNSKYGIHKDTIFTGIKRNKAGKQKSWQSIFNVSDKSKRDILLSTIPKSTVKKYGLPTIEQAQAMINGEISLKKADDKQKVIDREHSLIKNSLIEAIENDFTPYIKQYNDIFPANHKKAIQQAQVHSLFIAIIKLKYNRTGLKKIWNVCKEVLGLHPNITLKVNNYSHFCLNISNAEADFKADKLLFTHGRLNKIMPYKMTSFHKKRAMAYFCEPNSQLYTFEYITNRINNDAENSNKEKGTDYKPISVRTVQNFLKTPEIYNSCIKYRNPELEQKLNGLFLRRHLKDLQYGQLANMDGTQLNLIKVWNEDHTKKISPNIFWIIDVASRKITGFCVSENEDRHAVFQTLHMSTLLEGCTYHEIVRDNGSWAKTEEFKQLEESMFLRGVTFRAASPGNAKDKTYIERATGTFQGRFLSMLSTYLGEGIRSKHENRPALEALKMAIKDNAELNIKHIYNAVAKLISIYNETPQNGKTPSEKAHNKESAIKIRSEETALMFWKSTLITVRNGEVRFNFRNIPYIYDVYDHNLKLRLNGQTIRVYYDEYNIETIHVFDEKNQKYICELRLKKSLPVAACNRTETDNLEMQK